MTTKMKRAREQSEMVNFYTLPAVEALATQYHNPGFADHGITVPFRMCVIGSSGSGKTNVLLNLLNRMTGTFNSIYLFTRNADEPLYEYLRQRIPAEQLHVHEGLDALYEMNLDTQFANQQALVVFDDLVLTKDQSKIGELYLRGRKLGKGVSIAYLSQSYTGIPKIIRGNCSYIVLKRVASDRDINYILKESSVGVQKDDLLAMYKYAIDGDMLSFLLIDLNKNQFRRGFQEVLDV